MSRQLSFLIVSARELHHYGGMSGEEPTAVHSASPARHPAGDLASARRRLAFPSGQLHRVIQAAFGWWDYHSTSS